MPLKGRKSVECSAKQNYLKKKLCLNDMVLLLLAIFHSHLNYFTYNCKYVQSILLKKRQYLNNNGRQTPSPQ